MAKIRSVQVGWAVRKTHAGLRRGMAQARPDSRAAGGLGLSCPSCWHFWGPHGCPLWTPFPACSEKWHRKR